MKLRILSMFVILVLALVGCNTNGNDTNQNEEGRQGDNVQPTRYNTDDGKTRNDDGMTRNNRNNRDYTLDRDQDHRGHDHRGYNREDRDNTRDNDRYDIADEAADRITDEVDEIDLAYVLTTDNNAYVAATIDNEHRDDHKRDDNRMNREADDGEELTDDIKNNITDIVQSVDDDIDNVYVSTNPDFFDLTDNYVDDMNNGKPVRGFFDQFGNMIERLFPQNKR